MSVEMQLQQVVKDESGMITMYVNFVDSVTGKRLKQKCVQGRDKDEIKAAIAPVFEKIKKQNEQDQALKDMATAALSELAAEVEK